MRSTRVRRAAVLGAVLALCLTGTASAEISSLTIDERAQLSPGRQAVTVTGTIACSVGDTFGISARVIQGRREGTGFLTMFGVVCTGEPQAWAIRVQSAEGLWKAGRASAGVSAQSSGPSGVELEATDRLVRVVR